MDRGRFAPSPTGRLHLGNGRTALLAWLWARSGPGQFLLRIEDLDRPRCRSALEAEQLEDLRWLGLDWDEEPCRQSERTQHYEAALARLGRDGLVYDCFCSRAQVRAAQLAGRGGGPEPTEASAPHGQPDEEPRYPGTCAQLSSAQAAERRRTRPAALRLRTPAGPVEFEDAVAGPCRFDPGAEVGDFVLRRADGLFAYQLAVVVDDAAQAVTQVLRGADLLPSTARQLLLYRLLGLEAPRFAHVPLLLAPGPPGEPPRRLSKRAGAETLAGLRAAGADPQACVARLARSAGLAGKELVRCAPRDLLGGFSLQRISGSAQGPGAPD